MQDIAVVINYCSNEQSFIDACIEECSKFSNEIVVSYGSHLYDGKSENHAHINEKKNKYPFVKFTEYPVDKNIDLKKQKGVENRPHAYWHNLARSYGVKNISKNKWVLFLDVDEIPDGNRFKLWNKTHQLNEFNIFKIANYWYFKKPIFQALTWEDTPVLAHINRLSSDTIFGDRERDHIAYSSPNTKVFRYVLGNDFEPMIHHYSWVRSPDQMLFKLKNWGHTTDFNNHEAIVKHIFRNDEINDVVHNYKYIEVPNYYSVKI